MLWSALLRLWLLSAALPAAGWAQRQRFSCNTDGSDVLCRSGSGGRVEFLDQTATWREAHQLCRRRRGFLVPSRAVFAEVILRELHEPAAEHGDFWLGAKYLRSDYFEWLLQTYGK